MQQEGTTREKQGSTRVSMGGTWMAVLVDFCHRRSLRHDGIKSCGKAADGVGGDDLDVVDPRLPDKHGSRRPYIRQGGAHGGAEEGRGGGGELFHGGGVGAAPARGAAAYASCWRSLSPAEDLDAVGGSSRPCSRVAEQGDPAADVEDGAGDETKSVFEIHI